MCTESSGTEVARARLFLIFNTSLTFPPAQFFHMYPPWCRACAPYPPSIYFPLACYFLVCCPKHLRRRAMLTSKQVQGKARHARGSAHRRYPATTDNNRDCHWSVYSCCCVYPSCTLPSLKWHARQDVEASRGIPFLHVAGWSPGFGAYVCVRACVLAVPCFARNKLGLWRFPEGYVGRAGKCKPWCKYKMI